ncbi:hypothetical protein KJY73_18395 [Bowmanella sp. Y26]|uniref:hypothetical protein n=1 Tax=Bowmanella yangjiangensis TaxID=2811230 RepID=UPI001BDD2007|nr:hypothetical protein [Bowmanella yangjiangensis]MBT1065556.1 hypothetical protein [Bowmanella yangjiangensis]
MHRITEDKIKITDGGRYWVGAGDARVGKGSRWCLHRITEDKIKIMVDGTGLEPVMPVLVKGAGGACTVSLKTK